MQNNHSYQVLQEGSAFKLIQSEAMMIERINYIHNNLSNGAMWIKPHTGAIVVPETMKRRRV